MMLFSLDFEYKVDNFNLYIVDNYVNPILLGGGGVKYAPLLFFLYHLKTAQGIKLKLSDFKDTLLRHILQVKPVR